MSSTFYVIETINRKEETGWVIERPDGIYISEKLVSDVKRFKNYKKAEIFTRRMKTSPSYKSGSQFFIRSSEYLMENKIGMVAVDQTVWYIEDEEGNKVFYNPKEEGYYFGNEKVGYCYWQTEDQAKQNIKLFESSPQFGHKKLVAKSLEPKK